MQTPMVVSGEQPRISVWLDERNNAELKKFHCPVCGKVVFEYYSSIRIIMPGDMGEIGKSPIVIQCHGAITVTKDGYLFSSRCKAKFFVE